MSFTSTATATVIPHPTPTPTDSTRRVPPPKPSIKISRATPSQITAIAPVIAAAFRKYIPILGRPPTPMQADFKEQLQLPDRTVYVLHDNSCPSLSTPGPTPGSNHSSSTTTDDGNSILGTMTIRIPDPVSDTGADEETNNAAYEDALQVNYFAVSPNAQGRGYGRVLLEFAEMKAREEGKKAVMLFTGAKFFDSMRFYN